MEKQKLQKEKFSFIKWIKRLGVAGFLFFFIKGLVVWIVIPALIAYFAW